MAQKYPQIGLQAVLEVAGFKKNANQYFQTLNQMDKATKDTAQKINRSTGGFTKSWDQFSRDSKAFADAFKNLDNTGFTDFMTDARAAWQSLGKDVKINAAIFDEFIQKGYGVADAMRAASGVDVTAINVLGRSFSETALVIGTVTAGLTAYINLIRSSIKDYTAFAEQVRRVRLELGVTAQEASLYVRAAEANNVSTQSLATAFGQLERNLINYKLRLMEGNEESTNFVRALNTLNVPIEDANGNLRSSSDIIDDVNNKLRELGPGWVTTGLAQDVYGRGAYNLLPLLISEGRSLEDIRDIMQSTSSAMSTEGAAAAEEYAQAGVKLNLAWAGVTSTLSNSYLPALTWVKNALADVLTFTNKVDASVRALGHTIEEWSVGMRDQITFAEFYRQELARLLNVQTEEQKKTEELTLAKQREAQETLLLAQAEEERAKQVAEINTKIDEAYQKHLDKLADIAEQFNERWADLMESRRRDTIEREMRLVWELQDLWTDYQDRRADIIQDYADKQVKYEQDYVKKLIEHEENANKKREDLERKHQERLLQIQLDYQDSVDEAVRKNDAVAVLQAMRQRARELRDEERKYNTDRSELEEQLADQRQKIEEDRREREQQDQLEKERALERARQDYQKRLEEQRLSQERERILRELHYRWEEEDFRKAKARQIAEAKKQYNRELQELKTQLAAIGSTVTQSITNLGATAATATVNAIRNISSAAASEIQRYGHLLINAAASLSPSQGRSPTGRPITRMAEGGTLLATSPTHVLMGEAGPEVATFTPLGRSMTVNHKFSRMGVDFGGVPSGVNTAQVESIVTRVMTHVAEQLLAGA